MREIEIEIEQAPDEAADDTETERSEQYTIFTFMQTLLLIFRFAAARQRRQVMRLLANSEIGRLFHLAPHDSDLEDDDEDDEDFHNPIFRRRRRRRPVDPYRFPKVPSDKGSELMNSGTFGSNEVDTFDMGSASRKKKLAMRIMDRELATEGYAQQRVNQKLMAQVRLFPIPSTSY